ncbi:MAG: saccharopine dehydrogenase NADP-binding domain-containing protein [Spirochaetaceae bacterium]|nr:saccharopine dehydrogenase NADP-binding domain-containing protein [Spirochaetaceae bacterium]
MKQWRVVQLGYGMQGQACLVDLRKAANIGEILVADSQPSIVEAMKALGDPRVRGVQLDATNDEALANIMQGADVVIELLPGLFALKVARVAARVGVNLVSTMYLLNPGEQDPVKRQAQKQELAEIDAIMRSRGKTILEEFGMDPGIDLVLGRKALDEFDEVHAFHSYGAGFPEKSAANNPIHYKFTWSIIGVMRSYLRPAVVIKDGKEVQVPADEMFAPQNTHILDLPEMGGPLECFPNGDSSHFAGIFGLKGSVRSMGRYICRWPGHAAFWSVMAKCGFLSDEPLQVGDVKVAPTAFCASLFSSRKEFFYGPKERDIALIRADVRGIRQGKPTQVIYQIIDYRDLDTGLTAMQRTVGFPASIGAQMILDGRIAAKGVLSPAMVDFDQYMKELAQRGIRMTRTEMAWDGRLEP